MSPFLSTQNSDTKKTGPDHYKYCSESYNSNLIETSLQELRLCQTVHMNCLMSSLIFSMSKLPDFNLPVWSTSQKMKVTTNSKCAKDKLRPIIINRTLQAFNKSYRATYGRSSLKIHATPVDCRLYPRFPNLPCLFGASCLRITTLVSACWDYKIQHLHGAWVRHLWVCNSADWDTNNTEKSANVSSVQRSTDHTSFSGTVDRAWTQLFS